MQATYNIWTDQYYEDSLTSCDKCDKMHEVIESKMFTVIKGFSKFAKMINEEQKNMNINIDNTMNTVNLIIDQLDKNEIALSNSEKEIKKLKKEIKQLKNENTSSTQIQQKSTQLSSIDKSNSYDNDSLNKNELQNIKTELSNLKTNLIDFNKAKHDIDCLKYEVKKIKRNAKSVVVTDKNTHEQIVNDELNTKINELKKQIEEMKNKQSKKKVPSLSKKKDKQISLKDIEYVESKYYESASFNETDTGKLETIIIDKLNTQQSTIDFLKDELRNIKDNNVSQEKIKKIKKQIKKLSKRADNLEEKGKNTVKNNNDSEEDDTEKKENEAESDSRIADNINNDLHDLISRVSSLELKTNEISDLINQPRVHQIFVDLPNTKACNLLFRAPKEQINDLK